MRGLLLCSRLLCYKFRSSTAHRAARIQAGAVITPVRVHTHGSAEDGAEDEHQQESTSSAAPFYDGSWFPSCFLRSWRLHGRSNVTSPTSRTSTVPLGDSYTDSVDTCRSGISEKIRGAARSQEGSRSSRIRTAIASNCPGNGVLAAKSMAFCARTLRFDSEPGVV